jgi:hypothetical protein
MTMEHWWNDTERGKRKCSRKKKNLSQCHSVYQKSHMDWPLIEPGPPRWDWHSSILYPLHTNQHAVAQLIEALRYKPEGLIPDGVTGIFHWPHCCPGVDSASNRNEYQEYFLWGKGGRCVGLTNLPPSCADCIKIWVSEAPGTLRASPGV